MVNYFDKAERNDESLHEFRMKLMYRSTTFFRSQTHLKGISLMQQDEDGR